MAAEIVAGEHPGKEYIMGAEMRAKIKGDPAIEQIREIRHQISAEFGHDPDKVLAY